MLILLPIFWLLALLLLVVYPAAPPRKSALQILVISLAARALFLWTAGVYASVWPAHGAIWMRLLCDSAVLIALMTVLFQRRFNLRWALLYGLNPVALWAVFQGQTAVFFGLFCLIGSIGAYHRALWAWMCLLAGFAMGLFPLAATVVVFLVRRQNLKYLPLAAGMAVITRAGRYLSGNAPAVFPFSGFDGFVHRLAETLWAPATALLVTSALFCLLLVFGWWYFHPVRTRYHHDPLPGIFFVTAAWLLVMPAGLPAILGVAALAALQPGATWMLFYLITAGLIAILPAGVSLATDTVVWLAYMPFLAFLLADWHRFFHRMKAAPFGSCQTVSVIVPTLNEQDRIKACIRSIQTDPAVTEIIVADAGSSDGTRKAAAALGARVICHRKPIDARGGRGGQIRAGLQTATGDVVAVVHADMTVCFPAFSKMISALKHNPSAAGGALGSRFDSGQLRFRIIAWANDARMIFAAIAFGDQVQFFRRHPVASRDLFPQMPLMEDVELSLRLNNIGRSLFLFGRARVSARKWKRRGASHAIIVIRLFLSYLVRRLWKTPDAAAMYRRYYGSSP
ncbi:MAG: glycosyltransferase [Thermodesulfobacteriota bacterium]